MVAAEIDPRRLVFVDEMGVHTSLAPLYGYSAKGERLRLWVPRGRGKNTTLLAAMTLDGMDETIMAVEGSTDREVFEAYLERARPGAHAGGRTGGGRGQPLRAQTGQGEGDYRVERLQADLPTLLLAGFQSDRRSVRQEDQGHPASRGSPHQGRLGRGTERSALGDQRPGRHRLLRARRLSSTSSTTVKRAVEICHEVLRATAHTTMLS